MIWGVNDMERKDWRFCSQEDETISLHDCVMDGVNWAESGIWLSFENGFNVTKDNSLNPTGRHRLTGKAAVFLSNGVYLEGAWNRNCTMQTPSDPEPILLQETPIPQEQFADWSPEVLDFTWEPENQRFSIDAVDHIGFCEINFSCTELWFCWNELPEDAWFQDWPKEVRKEPQM